jgi:phosphonopyruvate decarboxylase
MMNMIQACGVVAKNRAEDSILVATMGAMFIFDFIEGESGQAKYVPMLGGKVGLIAGVIAGKVAGKLSKSNETGAEGQRVISPRINSVPLMGGAGGLGLGLALAQPTQKVVVVDGDASLLMELSGLVTVARQAPANFLHIVIRNGTQFTGLANMVSPDPEFNFADAARNAGYAHTETIADAQEWMVRYPELLKMKGPVFVQLLVDPVPSQTKPEFKQQELPVNQFDRMGKEAVALQSWLQNSKLI